jgi:LytS/YehU family sensor histidine kinase
LIRGFDSSHYAVPLIVMKDFLLKNKVLILHLSFWVLYFTYRLFDIKEYLGFEKAFMYLSVPLVFNVAASYLHYFFILPNLIRDKKIGPYIVKLLLLLTGIVVIRIVFENQVFAQIATNEAYYKTIKPMRVISTIWDTLAFLIFTGMIRFTLDWFDLENKKKQLENEKLVAELNYLKAQINPHFLFNTLHNLNYLVYSGSKNATEVIIKLSNIMRYMIYDANKERVAIRKEIAYMNDYIHLESIRLNQKFHLDFKVNGSPDNVEIAPLVMLTFLENAFKHGVSDQEENRWIKIQLDITDSRIEYKVSNKKLKNAPIRNLKSGFGLENVKKRLALSYPGQHSLNIEDKDDVYTVTLTIKLS